MEHLVVVKREAMPDHIHGDNREQVQVAQRGQIEGCRITKRVSVVRTANGLFSYTK